MTIFAFIPTDQEIYTSGNISLDVSLEGNLKNIEASAAIDLSDGFFYDPKLIMPFTELEAGLLVRDGALILEKAAGQWALANIEATAELPLGILPAQLPFGFEGKKGAARFTVDVTDLQADAIRTVPRAVGGVVDLHVEGEAARLDLNALSARATFGQLSLKLAEFEIKQSAPSAISVSDGVAQIEQFTLTGPETQIQVGGRVGLTGDRAIELQMEGDLDAGVLTFMLEDFKAGGDTQFQIALRGQAGAPELSGFLQLKQGEMSLASPRLLAENLDVRLNFDQNQIAIANFTGSLNGGPLQVTGQAGYARAQLNNLNVNLSLDSFFLNFPEGLKTVSEAQLKISSQGNFIMIGGNVAILEGTYTDPLEIEGELLNYLRSQQELDLAGERSALLSRVRYDIALATQGPIVVDNKLNVVVDANLKVVGSYYRPALTGRMTLEEGGEIYLSERKYYLESGVIDFVNPTKIEPSLQILAKTEARTQEENFEISLHINGTPKDLSSSLTSDPPLPEPEIIAVLLTGRKLEEFRGAEFDVAKEQVLSYSTTSETHKVFAD